MINKKFDKEVFREGVLLFADDVREYQCASKMIEHYVSVKSREWDTEIDVISWYREDDSYTDIYVLYVRINEELNKIRIPSWFLVDLIQRKNIEKWKCKCIYCNQMMENECEQEFDHIYFSCECGAVYSDLQGWLSREDLIDFIGEN